MDGVVVRKWRTQVFDENGMPQTMWVVEARVFDELLARNRQTEKDLSELVDIVSDLRKQLNERSNQVDGTRSEGTRMSGPVSEVHGS